MHFRFRTQDAEYGYVWADVSSPADPLPFFEGCIMTKVMRVSEAATMHRQVLLKRKKKETLANQGAAQLHAPADAEVRHRNAAAPNATSEAKPAPYRDYDPSAIKSEAPQQSRQPQQPQQPLGPSPTRKASVNHASAAAPATAGVEDILSFDDSGEPSSGAAVPAAARATEMPQSEAKVLDRNELRMAKEQGIEDKVKQALDEKKEVHQFFSSTEIVAYAPDGAVRCIITSAYDWCFYCMLATLAEGSHCRAGATRLRCSEGKA